MKYFKRKNSAQTNDLGDNDPLSGVANLFDIGLVFIVGLLMMIFSAFHLSELFDESSDVTIMKKDNKGNFEIITKKGKKIEAVKVKDSTAKGRGEKLGIAYRLEDGSMIYVPSNKEE